MKHDATAEHLTKATHNLIFACDSLRAALRDANNVEALIIMPLIERAAQMQREVEALAAARQTGETK